MPVTPKACAHVLVLTAHGQRHKGRQPWGFAYMWMYTLTHMKAYTRMCECVCSHRNTAPCWRLIHPGLLPAGTAPLPVTAASIPAQPPPPAMAWIPPQPCVSPSVYNCALALMHSLQANPFVDSHCLHLSSSAPVEAYSSYNLLHTPFPTPSLHLALLAYLWLVGGLCLEPCPLLLSEAHAPLRIL